MFLFYSSFKEKMAEVHFETDTSEKQNKTKQSIYPHCSLSMIKRA